MVRMLSRQSVNANIILSVFLHFYNTLNNASVATVSNKKVTAVAQGTTGITAISNNGKKVTGTVTVKTSISYVTTNMVDKRLYGFKVRAVNFAGKSEWVETSYTHYKWITAIWMYPEFYVAIFYTF